MSEEADNSDIDLDADQLPNMRNLARPSFRWVVNLSNLADENDDTTESYPVTIDSDTDLIVVPVKRKLSEGSVGSTSQERKAKTGKKKCLAPITAGTSSAAHDNQSNTVEAAWHHLPQPLVVQIMLHLDNKSRLNMALCCKPWGKLISSACLWRGLNMELSSFQNISKPMVLFSKTHAKHFTRVVILWRRPSYILSNNIHNGLNKILGHLKDRSQLLVFRMHYMELDRYWRFEKRREKLINSLSKFLEVQTKLRTFVMNNAQAELTQGCKILESVAKYSGNKIETLNLEDFFQSRVAAFRVPQYMNAISRFTNVKHLYLNYNYLNEDIIEHFASHANLHILSVKVYKNDPHYHRISSTTWSKLKSASPSLEVNFEFDQIPTYSEIKPILVTQVPLRGMHVWSGYEEEDDWRISDTLAYLSKHFSKTLESFTLEIENDAESIDLSLIQMICCCKSLYHVDINAVINTSTVDDICKLQQEEKISLQSLYVTITGAPDSDTQDQLDEIAIKYTGMIEDYNLDFQFTADVIIPADIDYVQIPNNVHVVHYPDIDDNLPNGEHVVHNPVEEAEQ